MTPRNCWTRSCSALALLIACCSAGAEPSATSTSAVPAPQQDPTPQHDAAAVFSATSTELCERFGVIAPIRDFNQDGEINDLDVRSILELWVGARRLEDVNGDGSRDVQDAIATVAADLALLAGDLNGDWWVDDADFQRSLEIEFEDGSRLEHSGRTMRAAPDLWLRVSAASDERSAGTAAPADPPEPANGGGDGRGAEGDRSPSALRTESFRIARELICGVLGADCGGVGPRPRVETGPDEHSQYFSSTWTTPSHVISDSKPTHIPNDHDRGISESWPSWWYPDDPEWHPPYIGPDHSLIESNARVPNHCGVRVNHMGPHGRRARFRLFEPLESEPVPFGGCEPPVAADARHHGVRGLGRVARPPRGHDAELAREPPAVEQLRPADPRRRILRVRARSERPHRPDQHKRAG